MATAYAALVSIMQIIDQLQRHPRPPISIDKQQVQSLTEVVTSLQQFLEAGYNKNASYSDEADPLEMRIADAAHAVEDVIESHIVDRILADREDISSVDFYRAVQRVIDEMELVKKEAMDVMKEKMRSGHELPTADADSSTSAAASSSLDWPQQNTTMVGFDDILIQVLDKLTSHESRRSVISITGMGGMGKTTLAKNVYQHEVVAEHFYFLAWVKVSQQYKIRKLLLKLLEEEEQNLSQVDEAELGPILHKKLYGRRYLIIMDDIWDIEVWYRLRVFLPDNNNGSRIMITTRLSKLAREIDGSHNMIEMDILDEDNSWELFCKHVFGEEDCPLELQGIGKQIVEGCKGLPLSISVVGGLLAKFKRKKQYWEHIAENLHATVNLEGDKHCLQLLYISYSNLPVHLKPCFLIIGVTLDNAEDRSFIAMVVATFIAEGFVKPISGKTLEEAAKEYIIELVERNLILINKTDRRHWMYKECTMHDLLRDLCLRESHKQNFVYVVGERSVDNIPHSIDSIRRIVVAKNTPEAEVLPLLESASHLRSLFWGESSEGVASLLSICSRLLRVRITHNVEDDFQKVNLRLIDTSHEYRNISSMSRFWNLQMLSNGCKSSHVIMAPHDIWMMSQLRYISSATPLSLPDPPSCQMDCTIVLENLHTLSNAYNFKCSEEVVKRIPHIKVLAILHAEVEGSYDVDYCLNNLDRLQKLEILVIEVQTVNSTILVQNHQNLNITFPSSLLMLDLSGTTLHWDDVTTKIGYLPLLQSLVLRRDSCIGAKWETIEGQFCSLRALKIDECGDMEYWITENTHFPRLELLQLGGLHKLKEIPSSIGDIPTLQLIYVKDCCDSVYSSAQRIKEEQEELGNEDLQVLVSEDKYNSEEESSLEHETKNEISWKKHLKTNIAVPQLYQKVRIFLYFSCSNIL